jgi:hypothetical protein
MILGPDARRLERKVGTRNRTLAVGLAEVLGRQAGGRCEGFLSLWGELEGQGGVIWNVR